MILCGECNQENKGDGWCKSCNAKHFQQNFKNWTSGNNDVDKFIQDTQLSAEYFYKVLEWIPYNRLYNIEYITKGGFSKVYKANWIDGYIYKWDDKNQNWERREPNKIVALKSLNNSENITLEFMDEIMFHHKLVEYNSSIVQLYGITKNPDANDYVMVIDYAEHGSLRNYLGRNYNKLDWNTKLRELWHIAVGLNMIHKKKLIHRDLHSGNILRSSNYAMINDFGLCKPADYNISENIKYTKKNVYGVLPYIAPEILRGQNYTQASDVYSFGIIMYEVISGLPPYHDINYDENLVIKICKGLRPRFNIKVPQIIVHLIKRCLDADPLDRPTSEEIENILNTWSNDYSNQAELKEQIKVAEEENNNSSSYTVQSGNLGISYKIHSEAIYTSRLLNFDDLPESKNADDYYYKQNDDLISRKFAVTAKYKSRKILLRSSIILTRKISSRKLGETTQKLNEDCKVKEEFQVTVKLTIQGETMSPSSNSKNDYRSTKNLIKNLSPKQQIIKQFKLNHGLFLDGCSIEPSKNAVFVEEGELNMGLYEGQPLVYTSINHQNSHINLLSFKDNYNDVELIKHLKQFDICVNFPVAKITYTANITESFLNFVDSNGITLHDVYGHLFSRKILIGGKLFISDLKSATSKQADFFKFLLTWTYDSAKYNKGISFSNSRTMEFFPKIITSDGEKLDTPSQLFNWMNSLYQKNMACIICYSNLVPISELRFNKSLSIDAAELRFDTSSSINEKQPGVANFKDKLNLEEWVKDKTHVNLIRWIKEFQLLQGLVINKHFELENSKKIAINFINIPNVVSSDKLYLEMIKPTTSLEEYLIFNDRNEYLDKDNVILPIIKELIKSDDLSYDDYTNFLVKFERYRISLSRTDIEPSEEFKQAIEKALENMKPFVILQSVFNEFGYFFPLNITLGKSLKSILQSSSSNNFKKVDLGSSTLTFETLISHLANLKISYLLTQKGDIIEKDDLSNWIENIKNTDNLEIIEYDNIISLYNVLDAEQQKKIDVVLNNQNDSKIIMTGIVDLEDLDNNNIEHYKRINIIPSLGEENYEVFGSVISDKKENLKSNFFVRFGLYDVNGFSAMIKTLNKNNKINITECYILWMIIGTPSKLLVFSPRNRELQVDFIKESVTLQRNNSYCSIKTFHKLSQGDTVSFNFYCSTTNYEPINIKLIGWTKNSILFQVLDETLTNSEATIIMDICVCILSSEYKSIKIDNGEESFHSCYLNLIGHTLTRENFIEKSSKEN